MNNKNLRIVTEAVEKRFLPFVRRPSRYIGGEFNQIRKELSACSVKFALCFPDVYEIGMSHTGFAIIYHVLNGMEGVCAERVFAPWIDAEEILRREKVPLFTLESKAAVGDFDIIGFSLTNELCYTNMLNMLNLAGVPIRSEQRSEDDPLVIAGGQAANCCEPIADFVDCFILGEGEQAVVRFVELAAELKKQRLARKDILLEIARRLPFAYVPSLYRFEYENESIRSFEPTESGMAKVFESAFVEDLDISPVPPAPIVPFTKAVHERVSVEIMRGCPGRCRFCQASFCRRPLRFRSVDRIVEIAQQQYHASGFDTVSLLSLSTADYPGLEELIEKLGRYFEPLHVGVSVPSLKVQAQLKLLPKLVSSVRKSGLTIAVEAASEKLRRVINKPISDADLFAGIEAAYREGFAAVKLYFMVGFPGETEDDIIRIADLADRIARLRRNVDGRTAGVNAAVSWLVPKPHTPFGWLGQKSKDYFLNARKLILDRKHQLNARSVQFKFHNIETSILESATGRGDRRLGAVIENAWRLGAKFDLWSECFSYDIWQKAFAEHGMDMEVLSCTQFAPDQILPWEHLGGPAKKYLLEHYNHAIETANENIP